MATEHDERLRPEDVPPTELVELLSVGIDIGTATSHLVFSKLMLVRLGISMSSRYVVASRECLYESDILLTPYIKGTTIDADALRAFISEAYKLAGVDRSQVDTGALILTGEAVKKRNAKAIADIFAEEAGRLVAVTAGDSLEAMMTAHGSGAVEMSKRQQNTIMSVDTGGGTSKIAIINKGQVIETAVISVGARLIVVDDDGIVNRLEEAGYWVGRELGLNLKVGRSIYKDLGGSQSTSTMEDMAKLLAKGLLEVIGRQHFSPLTKDLMRTAGFSYSGPIDAILFSGGMSEYIYSDVDKSFGDLGRALAREVSTQTQELGIPILEPAQRIRATVIGASQYTVQVSGNTIYVSDESALPVRNLPVLVPNFVPGDEVTSKEVETSIAQVTDRFNLSNGEQPIALALQWQGTPTYRRIDAMAQGILNGLRKNILSGMPVVVVFEGDVAHLIGASLAEHLGPEHVVLSLDGLELKDFDYIDIGQIVRPALVAPVVIKSLVFPVLPDWYNSQEENHTVVQ